MNVPDVCVALPRILPNNHSFIGTGYRKGMKQIKLSASSASSESVYLEAGTKKVEAQSFGEDRLFLIF